MTLVGTHSGSFHADEVFAIALIRAFIDPEARWVRTRDLAQLAECDIVVDVGGIFDVASRRFDHHQKSYTGELSSAGMVLDWLEADGHVPPTLARQLRSQYTQHIDAVDTGRVVTGPRVPCISSLVATLAAGAGGAFDAGFGHALDFAHRVVTSVATAQREVEAARAVVKAAMSEAEATGSRVLWFDGYVRWKTAYFELGGVEHPTWFVAFPDGDRWKLVCIPPEPGSFANKRDLPAAWAGLTDADLEAASGVEGALFCHKNRFIAAFTTRAALDAALEIAVRDGI